MDAGLRAPSHPERGHSANPKRSSHEPHGRRISRAFAAVLLLQRASRDGLARRDEQRGAVVHELLG